MITTKYNFKSWMSKKYPDIKVTNISGIPAYLLSKDLDPADSCLYDVRQLKDGRYIVFIGVETPNSIEELTHLRERIQSYKRSSNKGAPTTFTSFEQWLSRNNIVPLHRTYCSHKTASQILMTRNINNCTNLDEPRAYYLYELQASEEHNENVLYSRVPYITTESGTVAVLVKAGCSNYKPKRKRLTDTFAYMQPLYEQVLQLCTQAQMEEKYNKEESRETWIKAQHICEQYMGIQFEIVGTISLDALKEAANAKELGIFVRTKSNLIKDDDDTDNRESDF